MTITEEGADMLIAQFGEDVTVTSMDNEVPDDASDPIFIDSSGVEGSSETHRVRLYTTPSQEMLEEYGFDEATEAIMYSREEIATEGDKVEYSPRNAEWVVISTSTNQIGNGPYLFVFSMKGV